MTYAFVRVPEQINDFKESELVIFNQVCGQIYAASMSMSPEEKHRLLLGAASALIDKAADHSVGHRPSIRIVELGILAERVGQLALDFDVTNDSDCQLKRAGT